jgi:outer membrane protein assembly factor BamA
VKRLTLWLFIFLIWVGPTTRAQTPRKLSKQELPPSAFKLISIKVTGATRYRPDEIIKASGLEMGQDVNEDDFKKATQDLGDTGAFTNIVYNFQYSNEGTKLELQVQENDKLLPVQFENLVWFTDKQLLDELHSRIPLFQGQLPIAGSLADQVSQALQIILLEKNIQGTVDYLRVASQDGPITAFAFTVTGPHVTIRNVTFTGSTKAEAALLETAARPLQGTEYRRSLLRVQDDKIFLPIFLERGYLKADFGEPQATVLETGPAATTVDAAIPVDPGQQYTLSSLEISGNSAFPADQLLPLIHLQSGQPANAVQLEKDTKAIGELYGTRGYMAAEVHPTAQFDEAHSTVKYVISIIERDVYHMGDLEIKGLDAKLTAHLMNEWTLRTDDPYDSSYPERFLKQTLKEVATTGEWVAAARESLNEKDRTVDVTLRFNPKR